jgi:XRE family transcriptional regulator, regulator of sulfur utilization
MRREELITERDAYMLERTEVLRTFGAQLRGLREQRSLAQEGLAEVANLHRNEIGVLERGQCEPRLMTLLILGEALEVPPCALLDGLPVPRQRRPRRASQPPSTDGEA